MSKKRVDIVSLQMVKEKSVLYEQRKVSSPWDAFMLLKDFLSNADREKLMVVCLNTKNEPVNITTVSVGTINSSLASTRDIVKTAILSNSPKILLAHNHPSGDTTPSKCDWKVTERLVLACSILDIELVDHIIIADQDFVSLRNQNDKVFTKSF